MKHIPNFVTSLNLISGFIAIIFAAGGNIVAASWLILAAMTFDFLDGLLARLLKAYSAIGKELDSLADIVSFGVAPGLIIYQLLIDSGSMSIPVNLSTINLTGILFVIIPAIMAVCAAIRLAVFNLDSTQATSFKGLPTPANALAVISVIIGGHYSHSTLFDSFAGSPLLLMIFSVILSILMVSRIPLLSLKVANLKLKGNEGRYILLGLVIITFVIFGPLAIPLVVPLYIISSLISLFF